MPAKAGIQSICREKTGCQLKACWHDKVLRCYREAMKCLAMAIQLLITVEKKMTQHKDINLRDCYRFGMTLLQFMSLVGIAGIVLAVIVKLFF
jgi:hypothetical protein